MRGAIIKDMESSRVFLISPGGSGVNMLYSRFGKDHLCGYQENFNPHQRFPQLPDFARILYVMAHPLNILLSFERRGFFDLDGAVINMQGDVNEFKKIVDNGGGLSRYAKNGKNCFGFKHHFSSWASYAINTGAPFMLMKYEELPHKWGSVQSFVGKRAEIRWKRRKSNYATHKLRNRLSEIHKEDIEFYNKIITWKQV